jgi:hypothetical protein
MDLKKLIPENDTVTITLKHPGTGAVLQNEDGSDMTISFYLPHAKEAKKAQHEITNRRLKKMSSGKKFELTAEELEDLSVESLAKTTVDWNLTYDGDKPKYTVAKAKEIYSEIFWIRGQVEEAIAESMDFTKL